MVSCPIKPIDPRELFEAIMVYLKDATFSTDSNDEPSSISSLSDTVVSKSSDAPDSEIDVKKEIEKLPVWLKIIPQLDLSAGVNN